MRSAHEAERAALAPGEMRQLERKGEGSVRMRLQDLIDRAVFDTLATGGKVVVMDVATLGSVTGVGATLRY